MNTKVYWKLINLRTWKWSKRWEKNIYVGQRKFWSQNKNLVMVWKQSIQGQWHLIMCRCGLIEWTKDKLRTMAKKTRKTMTVHRALHPQADVDRLYTPRTSDGRGIIGTKVFLRWKQPEKAFRKQQWKITKHCGRSINSRRWKDKERSSRHKK